MHAVEVLAACAGPWAPAAERQLDLGPVEDPAAVALDVDDDGVQLGAGDEVEHAGADPPVAHAVVGEVGGLDRLRLERHVQGRMRGSDRHPLVAGGLDDERRVRRHRAEREGSVGVRPGLLAVDDDRRARERSALGVSYAAADARRPSLESRRRGCRSGNRGSGRRGRGRRTRRQARRLNDDRRDRLGSGRGACPDGRSEDPVRGEGDDRDANRATAAQQQFASRGRRWYFVHCVGQTI